MQKWKTLMAATAALLVFATVAVLADGTDVNDWWTEMKEQHTAMHGDDFEAHHQAMHGEDWQEDMASCHDNDSDNHMGTGMMGRGKGSMMGTAWI